jgi:hypothetical protein
MNIHPMHSSSLQCTIVPGTSVTVPRVQLYWYPVTVTLTNYLRQVLSILSEPNYDKTLPGGVGPGYAHRWVDHTTIVIVLGKLLHVPPGTNAGMHMHIAKGITDCLPTTRYVASAGDRTYRYAIPKQVLS